MSVEKVVTEKTKEEEIDMNNRLDEFTKLEQNEACIYVENYKLIKLIQPAYIFCNQIRNHEDKLYINSISVESVDQTKDYVYIQKYGLDILSLKQSFTDLRHVMKNELYVDGPKYCWEYSTMVKTFKKHKRTTHMNNNVFYCTHNQQPWAHVLLYAFPLIYTYYLLKKRIPDLVLILQYRTPDVNFLLDILGIKDVIRIGHDERIVNTGVTYFAGQLNCNFTKSIIDNFFYNLIVKTTILANPVDVTHRPKKLLFLRNTRNVVSAGILANRQQIVELASKYGYVDIDQTRLSLNETIHLMNNATHVLCESGGACIHLLWSLHIKSIVLNYRGPYFTTMARLFPESSENLKLISDNMFVDIVKHKNACVINSSGMDACLSHNANRHPPYPRCEFPNIETIELAIKKQETSDMK